MALASRTVPSWVASRQSRGLAKGYRSGLEARVAKQLEDAGITVAFETLKIPYRIPESTHKYTPDFPLPNGIIIETKGIFDSNDRAKHLLVRAQDPELDIRLVFTRSKAPIYKGSPTTMADWCEKNGIKYADKTIPPSWLSEAGPKRKPEEVLADGPYGFAETIRKKGTKS